jgi:ComF family protein
MLEKLYIYINSIFQLCYPKICAACAHNLSKQENVICTICSMKLPYTHFYKLETNPLEKKFWGRIPIENIDSFLYFEKGSLTQELLHKLKYESRQDVGLKLAELLIYYYQEKHLTQKYDGIITIPLHPAKEKIRGYNQCDSFAKKLSSSWEIPYYKNSIVRLNNTVSQTGKNRIDRWDNVNNIFEVKEKENLGHKHLLLIDDVITTGATIEACAQEILKLPNCRISVLTMACKI